MCSGREKPPQGAIRRAHRTRRSDGVLLVPVITSYACFVSSKRIMLPVLALPIGAPNDALPTKDGQNKLRRGGAGPSGSSYDSEIESLSIQVRSLELDATDPSADVYSLLAVAGALQRRIYDLLSTATLSGEQRSRLGRSRPIRWPCITRTSARFPPTSPATLGSRFRSVSTMPGSPSELR